MPAKTKYYALVLLYETLETSNSILVSLFEKYLLSRLVKIAMYKTNQ